MYMSAARKTFRLWWQKPRKVTEIEEDRSVSFLELFYDLAYVVIVAELTHALVKDVTGASLIGFAALFTLVWWAWVNGSMYHEMHGNYDIRTRVFTFLQMFALVGMAMFAPTALDDGAVGFSISYALFLTIITFLWWRTGVHDPQHRPMAQPYTIGFLVTTILFYVAAATEAPTTYYLWTAGMLLSLMLPLLMISLQRHADPKQVEAALRVRESLVERFGLLTIIVLGEVVVAVVVGVLHHPAITIPLIANAGLGLGIAMALWWIYFDFGSHHVPIQKTLPRFSWIYLHLPMTMSIALTGAGVLMVLEHGHGLLSSVEQRMLTIPVALFLFSVMLLVHTLDIDESHTDIHRQGALGSLFSGLAILALGLFPLSALQTLALIALLLVLPISMAVRMWVRGLQRSHA